MTPTKTKKTKKVVAVSGGFDPIHIGHARMFKRARELGDKLIVILNNDNWLRTKKGFAFMPEKERAEIIAEFPYVDEVVITGHVENDPDRSVCRELETLKPDIFANGGDRKAEADIPEAAICKKYGIEMVFGIGEGGKVQSSSWLTNAVKDVGKDIRPWGQFRVLDAGKNYWVKTVVVDPGHRLSLQAHENREEFWFCVRGSVLAEKGNLVNGEPVVTEKKILKEGEGFMVRKGDVHRLSSETGGTVIEVALGEPTESDITRFEDDYARN